MIQQGVESLESNETNTASTSGDVMNKKRPREPEFSGVETGVGAEPHNKKNSAAEPSLSKAPSGNQTNESEADSHSDMDTQEEYEGNIPAEDGALLEKGAKANTEDNITQKVNSSSDAPPAMGPDQWGQIMARFDSFEKSIQATIKEEIKINSLGIQKQVKSLSGKVKVVETHISENKKEIAKINQKMNRDY